MNNDLKKLIRPHFKDLKGYVSAGMESDKSAEKTYLNANENPYEIPGLEGLNRYPEPQPKALLNAYAKAYGCAPEQILATHGSDEAIALLSKTFCEPHKDSIAVHSPTFGMYAVNGRSLPVEIKDVPLIEKSGDFHLDKDGLIGSGAKLIYLCSPNNPTGTSFPAADLLTIVQAVGGESIVVLDEAYIEFARAESLAPALADHPNLIILRTLSKAYALAGARMGCMISGDPDFITLMREKVSDIYPIPKPSINAALKSLSHDPQPNINKILGERSRIAATLQSLILEGSSYIKYIYPSDTNFLLVKMDKATEFCAFAKEHNVILRDFSAKPGAENCLRLTIGTPEQNDLVLKLLNEFAS